MASNESELLQGTLDVLILKALALQELHGMGISRRIGQMTNGRLRGEGRLAISRTSPNGTGWLAHFQLGPGGNEPACKVLCLNQDREKTAANRNRALGSRLFSYGCGARDRPGGAMISRLRALWNNVFRRKQLDHDLDEELEAYVELVAAEKLRAGYGPGRGAWLCSSPDRRNRSGRTESPRRSHGGLAGQAGAGCALRHSNPRQESDFFCRRRGNTGAWNRRKHRDVQPTRSGGSQASARQSSRAACNSPRDR